MASVENLQKAAYLLAASNLGVRVTVLETEIVVDYQKIPKSCPAHSIALAFYRVFPEMPEGALEEESEYWYEKLQINPLHTSYINITKPLGIV